MITTTILFPAVFLFLLCVTSSVRSALNRLTPNEFEEECNKKPLRYYLFRSLLRIFPNERTNPITDFLSILSLVTTIAYGVGGIFYLLTHGFPVTQGALAPGWFFLAILLLTLIALLCVTLFNLFANRAVFATLKLFTHLISLYLILLFPIIYPIYWVEKKIAPDKKPPEPKLSSEKLKKRLLELLEEPNVQELLDPRDIKSVRAMANFGTLVAREIMVPRVDIVALKSTATVSEALKIFVEQGYSRIPVFEDTIDHITGLVLYKAVMEFCLRAFQTNIDLIKTTPIQTLITSIIFTPENKRIQDLFQEIRTQKIHVAVVVNEYGCTEGLVTIEDILEALVGSEIQDEHDIDEESHYIETQDKSYIVDAKMSIIDAEKEFGITIPHSAEYETLGGFISWKMRLIPPQGTILYHDNFSIKVLHSDKRQIYKVKIAYEVS